MREQVKTLKHHPHLEQHLSLPVLIHSLHTMPLLHMQKKLVLNKNLPAGDSLQLIQAAKKCRFTCAGRSDYTYNLSLLYCQIYVFKHLERAKALA